ncbi:MAG: histidine phosphatase family protein [Planctomycetota bacterium]|jgi:phosphohistidine phosphatase SixA
MKPKLTLTVLAAAVFFFGAAQDTTSRPQRAKPATVFLLRHAETEDRTKTNDPKLSAAGERRAKALLRLLGNAGVTHLFATDYQRTQLTLAPLATSTKLQVKVISARKSKEQLGALRSLPAGAVAVVAGHSNTVPGLVTGLGGNIRNLSTRGFIANDVHDRLFVVTLPTSRLVQTQTIELRLGAPSGGD